HASGAPRTQLDRGDDHPADHCAGIEAGLPPRACSGDGDVEPRAFSRPHGRRRARSVHSARLAHRAATTHRGGAGGEAPPRWHAGTLRRGIEVHWGGGAPPPPTQVTVPTTPPPPSESVCDACCATR